jgi:arylsulfatase A-like enzyme
MQDKPNIMIIYADDLGFGDLGCYGATDIPTPNLDRLAEQGVKFNNGYAAAATCTPARYSLLTGAYPYRHPRAAILTGDAASLFSEGAPTLPSKLKSAGYRTGIVGKWHLGLGDGEIDWNKDLTQTPNDIGFDHSFIMAATNDRVPCVYLKNRNVVNLDPEDPIKVSYQESERDDFKEYPTGRDNPELLRMKYHHGHDGSIVNGVSRIGYMKGGKSALWNDETMCDVFTKEAKAFITDSGEEPFFLYYALHQPHVPRIPAPRFAGKTKLGVRGDVIVELDWCVGEILNHLEKQGLSDNTMVIFSSDNGPVLNDGYVDQAVERSGDHRQAGPLRGGKYSLYDGGTRVPFILSWPRMTKPTVSDAIVSQTDFFASFCSLLGSELEEAEAPDSLDLLDAFLGRSQQGRTHLLTEGIDHKTVLREEDWVYIPPHEGPLMNTDVNIELGNADEPQLYCMASDVGQKKNRASSEPQRVTDMDRQLNAMMRAERTR